eukprot:COSAG01_NODE_6639_length_3567_cov_37.767013_1_plen_44_part_10
MHLSIATGFGDDLWNADRTCGTTSYFNQHGHSMTNPGTKPKEIL